MTDDASTQVLTDDDVTGELDRRHWRVVQGQLQATFRTGSFERGVELVQRIGVAAEAIGHHPDVHLSYPTVRVSTISHDVGGLTARDRALAGRVTAIAEAMGLDAETDQTGD